MSRSSRRGYAMLVVLILMAVIAIIGATSLSIAGTDSRIAIHNQRHMIVVNAADAGTHHARWQLQAEPPADEGWDTGDTGAYYIDEATAEASFAGSTFPMNEGKYVVRAVFQKCSNPPPGYSTEAGSTGFRSDFWNMESRSSFEMSSGASQINPSQAQVTATLRRVMSGACKVR